MNLIEYPICPGNDRRASNGQAFLFLIRNLSGRVRLPSLQTGRTINLHLDGLRDRFAFNQISTHSFCVCMWSAFRTKIDLLRNHFIEREGS